MPASLIRTCPVIFELSSDARNTTTPVMSSGSSVVPSTAASASASMIGAGTTAFVAGDIVTPGHTAFARMLRLPRIWAMRRVWWMIIHFVIP